MFEKMSIKCIEVQICHDISKLKVCKELLTVNITSMYIESKSETKHQRNFWLKFFCQCLKVPFLNVESKIIFFKV